MEGGGARGWETGDKGDDVRANGDITCYQEDRNEGTVDVMRRKQTLISKLP